MEKRESLSPEEKQKLQQAISSSKLITGVLFVIFLAILVLIVFLAPIALEAARTKDNARLFGAMAPAGLGMLFAFFVFRSFRGISHARADLQNGVKLIFEDKIGEKKTLTQNIPSGQPIPTTATSYLIVVRGVTCDVPKDFFDTVAVGDPVLLSIAPLSRIYFSARKPGSKH